MSSTDSTYKTPFHFQFLSKFNVRLAFAFSALIMLASLASLATRGLVLGIDFTGGTLVQVLYEQPVDLNEVRQVLQKSGYADAVVQNFGTTRDVLIRVGMQGDTTSEALSNNMLKLLQEQGHKASMTRVEYIGPQVGSELIEAGGLAILYTMIGILIYVAFRFEYRFAIGAVIAALHDPIVILGFFSITGMEFDLTVLAAILAVIGYSLNDTIVVFDRIRDNLLKMRKRDVAEVMNISINQTLVRTIMTSLTTLLTVLALFFLGGKLIHGFSASLVVGIIVGTYSSIYIASAISLKMGVSRTDLVAPPKEGAEFDQRP